ncbi:hypothetical protein C8J57DRAFT_1527738 [Mycena rebaudengoi]|nr:hypothetical protein C8J57DRAFT_1527738 [Mycena rebaudengoi]
MTSQFDIQPSPGSSEDPSTRLQLYILRQVAPTLKLRPLRRLLDMHDVSYSDKENVKKLRRKLQSFMRRLERGKDGDDTIPLTGTAHLGRRQEFKHLRSEWPQLEISQLLYAVAALRINHPPKSRHTQGHHMNWNLVPLRIGDIWYGSDFRLAPESRRERDDGTHAFHAFCSLDNHEPFRAEITGILKSVVNLTDGNQLVILGPRGDDDVLYADQQQSLARVVDVERGLEY